MLTVLPHSSFPVNRFGPTTTTDSGTTPGTQTSTFCIGSIHACTPNDIARLEEGKRTRQAFELITDAVLIVAGQGGQLPDWVQFNNMWFEVSALVPCLNNVMSHYEYTITKIENASDFQ